MAIFGGWSLDAPRRGLPDFVFDITACFLLSSPLFLMLRSSFETIFELFLVNDFYPYAKKGLQDLQLASWSYPSD
jgi:hypothetical protein